MNKLYFITGSQDLYGDETLKKAENNSKKICEHLNSVLKDTAEIVCLPIVRNREEAQKCIVTACADAEAIGVIMWMHTFSPAKMWINALGRLTLPMLHLHTQFNEKIPYDTIDMDFMNLNQSAHGDREFGFICSRLGIRREIVVGHYASEAVADGIRAFIRVASAIRFSHNLKVAMLGNNMRDVAVTDGDRVESEIKYGWCVNYYGIGDLDEMNNAVTDEEAAARVELYRERYVMATDDIAAVTEQAKYEIAIERFLEREGAGAFTDTFEDLHGLSQLPGLAVQNIMARGVGFGPEGDYKTSALSAVLCKMAEGLDGATGFTEDYTYDLTEGEELELAAHMLEVSPVFAKDKPKIEVHSLGIGGKNAPARLVFDGIGGEGIAVSMVDMGDRFRLICAKIDLIEPPKATPKLPVARLMWRPVPDFKTGAAAWIYAGGAHHAVVSTALTVNDIRLFARLTGTELVVIDEKTDLFDLEERLYGGK